MAAQQRACSGQRDRAGIYPLAFSNKGFPDLDAADLRCSGTARRRFKNMYSPVGVVQEPTVGVTLPPRSFSMVHASIHCSPFSTDSPDLSPPLMNA